jgi:hypothetical protein
MFEFDSIVGEEARQRNISYTRYADDMTFSAESITKLREMRAVVVDASAASPWPNLRVNEKKTIYVTRKYRRVVTGVVLTSNGAISVGRDRKRRLSAMIHHAKQGRLNSQEMAILAGELSFVNVVEPDFVVRMAAKYGEELLSSIKRSRTARR